MGRLVLFHSDNITRNKICPVWFRLAHSLRRHNGPHDLLSKRYDDFGKHSSFLKEMGWKELFDFDEKYI